MGRSFCRVFFAENIQVNGRARNTLMGMVHKPQLSKAGSCQGGSKQAAALPPSEGTEKYPPNMEYGEMSGVTVLR